jgi:hypothetical protein
MQLGAYSPGLHRIMALLDDRPEMLGRATVWHIQKFKATPVFVAEAAAKNNG